MYTQKKGIVMMDSSPELLKLIRAQIKFPDFYHPVSKLEEVELIMAQFVLSRLTYKKTDQFMCAIEGRVEVRLVPHINRNELYG